MCVQGHSFIWDLRVFNGLHISLCLSSHKAEINSRTFLKRTVKKSCRLRWSFNKTFAITSDGEQIELIAKSISSKFKAWIESTDNLKMNMIYFVISLFGYK